jgi:CheY-like chemotaxis protein
MVTTKPVILVVEDELLLRLTAVAIATEAGFQALSAATADEAISILEACADVRLVFTDVQMPVRWMDSGWRTPFATAGPPSS